MTVKIIEGGLFEDERGSISFVNDFKFDKINRFYIITNTEEKPVRAWQGHRLDEKNFYCIEGSFKVCFVKIDNWDSPSKDLKVEGIVLKSSQPRILCIPSGYANAIKSLEKNSKLISFSTLPLDQLKEDDVRYNINMWDVDE